ncbi:MAG: hypothetical protein K6G15_05540 [Desulfovibrio sp.]|nr:hypothetical protein [Desulfovibrio sp.]
MEAINCLWNVNQNNAFVEASKQKSLVRLRGCFPHEGEICDMLYSGHIVTRDGRTGIFKVKEHAKMPGKAYHQDDQCSFYFSLTETDQLTRTKQSHGVNASARIMSVVQDPKGRLSSLVLRFNRNYLTRPLRKNKRYRWNEAFTRLLRINLPINIPETKEELAELLRSDASQNKHFTPPSLVDISAGGCCAFMPRELSQTTFATEKLYLVFFMSMRSEKTDPPFIFLAKRLGYGDVDEKKNSIAVRMRFLAELDWSSRQKIQWFDIREDGSSRLSKHLELFESLTPGQG